jgi:hypothetical protein
LIDQSVYVDLLAERALCCVTHAAHQVRPGEHGSRNDDLDQQFAFGAETHR